MHCAGLRPLNPSRFDAITHFCNKDGKQHANLCGSHIAKDEILWEAK